MFLSLILFACDPKFLNSGLQGRPLHTESGGGSARASDNACRFAQGKQYVFAFDFLKSSGGSRPLRRRHPQLGHGRKEYRPLGQDHRAFDEILQFPNITRPTPRLEFADQLFGNGLYLLAHPTGELLHEILRQNGNVAGPLAQRRDAYGEDIQPVKKITAKLPFVYGLGEIAIGRGHQTYIDSNGFGAAQALELLILQNPQQLGLQFSGNFSDLVEEQRALVRQLNAAQFLADRAGECAFSWPNNSLSSRPVGIAAQFSLMKLSPRRELKRWTARRNQLFSGPGFAQDQHRCVARRGDFHLPERLA